jgi:hypothetical protein
MLTPRSVPAADPLYPELWRPCAGPLVDVPHLGDLVFYFPQGHIEQVGIRATSPPPFISTRRLVFPRDLIIVCCCCVLVSGGGVHEPGRPELDAPLRPALQAALPRPQRRAQGSPSPPPPFQLMCRVNFHRRSRTPTRSTRRSCSCWSRR